LKVRPDGSTEEVFEQQVPLAEIRNAQDTANMPEGLIVPITGLTYNPDDGLLYVALERIPIPAIEASPDAPQAQETCPEASGRVPESTGRAR
jgi:hypothetical protein